MRRDNFGAINEMRDNLHRIKKLTLEQFIMPDDEPFEGEDSFSDDRPQVNGERGGREEFSKQDITGIEKELTQIRKIALSVINRLADQPTSPQYDTMKKIWNMVDKAIEQPQKEGGRVE